MKKQNLIIGAVILVLVVALVIYFYYQNPNPIPKPNGEDNIALKLKEICDFDGIYGECYKNYSCEGKTLNLTGYTINANNQYAMTYRTGPGRAWIEIVSYDDIFPKNYDDYKSMRQNGKYLHQINIIEEGKGEELENKLKAIESDGFIPVKIIVKNAIIVGSNAQTMDSCTRGLYFEAKAEDISFEKV